ncbi:hypothetical protein HDU91_004694 [Kappamyces sp. JEL0680]|nr:hypothetical protein HDU91_004694 [Kappamyces sp. JEL0680]
MFSSIDHLNIHSASDLFDNEATFGSHSAFTKPKEKVHQWNPYPVAHSGSSARPPLPYAQLITEAIESTPNGRITLNGIYNYVMANYPYFETATSGWKNSVRHNLSLNKNFIRVPRPPQEKGKGAYWTINTGKDKTTKTCSGVSKRTKAAPAASVTAFKELTCNPDFTYSDPPLTFTNITSDTFAMDSFQLDETTTTSQQTFETEASDDYDRVVMPKDKGMYFGQFERMLAMEQMRQSSQTSIETFQNYEEPHLLYEAATMEPYHAMATTQFYTAFPDHGSDFHGVEYEYPQDNFWTTTEYFDDQ